MVEGACAPLPFPDSAEPAGGSLDSAGAGRQPTDESLSVIPVSDLRLHGLHSVRAERGAREIPSNSDS
jgi:hypothetical protein